MPASARSSAATTAAGAWRIGRSARRSRTTASVRAPASSSAPARLAATSALARSPMSATRSPGAIARQTSTAFRAPGERACDRAVPLRLAGLPSERDAGAAVLVVRLDDEAIAMAAQVRDEIDLAAFEPNVALAYERGPRHVAANDGALALAEQLRSALVGQHGEERLLVGNLAAQRVRHAHGARLVRRKERAALLGARHDVVDEHAAVDEIDAHVVGRQA